jgi:hypothetical protein
MTDNTDDVAAYPREREVVSRSRGTCLSEVGIGMIGMVLGAILAEETIL